MWARLTAGVIACLIPFAAIAQAPSIPDTPAGHVLVSWLDAFNSADIARIEAFDEAHVPWLTREQATALRTKTGGYDLLSIDKSSQLWISFRVKERAGSTQWLGSLVVKPDAPAVVSLLSFTADAKADTITLDGSERARLIETASTLLARFYVFPDVAAKVSTALEDRQKRGLYQDITDGEIFASRLTDDLRAFSGDKHLSVGFSTGIVPPDGPNGRPPAPASQPRPADNCGFALAQHLPPNIGYLKINRFAEPANCRPTAIAAMNFLEDCDALIIDLRDNRGGAPGMAALIASYLFDERTHLDDLYDRPANTTAQSWTSADLPGRKFTGKPVFVLVSKRTFSAAEEFSFDLKSLKRITLIGEATGGGAHAVEPHKLGDHFFIEIPFGRFINPSVKGDWEGTGVEPDIRIGAADALEEALRRARGGP